jgi:hypothetical protein
MFVDHLEIVELLAKKTTINPSTLCWEYSSTNSDGYGQLFISGNFFYAHRLAARAFFGFNMSSRYSVCHKCDNRKCWNPMHIFIGTTSDNNKDMRDKGRARGRYSDMTHCINGHELSGGNVYYVRRSMFSTERRRMCRTCRTINDRARKLRLKSKGEAN